MVIVEKPFVSEKFMDYLSNANIPVLETEFAKIIRNGRKINFISENDAIENINTGERIYATSEEPINWINANCPQNPIIKKINKMKNKTYLRQITSKMFPNYYFKELTLEELKNVDAGLIKLPCVIKPSVGFYSIGVYTIFHPDEFKTAVDDITNNINQWQRDFTDTVVGNTFLLEEYIVGTEYAIDAYYDDVGNPVILNILTHKFTSEKDVSDRLYYTNTRILEKYLNSFENFLKTINLEFNITDFPMHVEVRVNEKGIFPIEFNPMRFAGLCTTEIAEYAYGINTVDYYINKKRPDFGSIISKRAGKTYSLILLDNRGKQEENTKFDYNKLCANFENILEIRKVEEKSLGLYAFIFTETTDGNEQELEKILNSDLSEYLLFN